jgi:DnaJ-domain-containing protein 1
MTSIVLPDPKLLDAIRCILESSDKPFKEYDLIQTLNQQGWSFQTSAVDSLELFATHFVIYNALYHLQEEYWPERFLEISALSIVLCGNKSDKEPIAGSSLPSAFQNDAKLRDYYLDSANLESASVDSVNQLLTDFWERYIADGDAAQAYKVLSLEPPVRITDLKKTYRALAMEHHPDRGGDKQRFQEINWAFGVLQCLIKS